jgi:hypothetical protein
VCDGIRLADFVEEHQVAGALDDTAVPQLRRQMSDEGQRAFARAVETSVGAAPPSLVRARSDYAARAPPKNRAHWAQISR